MDRFTFKVAKFIVFSLIFTCPGLMATPTHVELRGIDLPAGEQGYLLPWQDATASTFLHDLCEDGGDIEGGMPLGALSHDTILRYAPCLSMIAQGKRHSEVPLAIELTLREYLRQQPDLYNAIHFADYLTVPLLKKVALTEAPARITLDTAGDYDVLSGHDYAQLCHNYILNNAHKFMNLQKHSPLGESTDLGSVTFSPDGTTNLGHAGSEQLVQSLILGENTAYDEEVTLSPDSKMVVTFHSSRGTRLWHAHPRQLVGVLIPAGEDDTRFRRVKFSPDSKMVATFDWNRGTRLWNAHNGQQYLTFDKNNLLPWVVYFSQDGKTIATRTYARTTIKLWNAQDQRLLNTFEEDLLSIDSVQFSTDGKTIALGYSDGTVKLWDVPTGKQNRTLPRHTTQTCCLTISTSSDTS